MQLLFSLDLEHLCLTNSIFLCFSHDSLMCLTCLLFECFNIYVIFWFYYSKKLFIKRLDLYWYDYVSVTQIGYGNPTTLMLLRDTSQRKSIILVIRGSPSLGSP